MNTFYHPKNVVNGELKEAQGMQLKVEQDILFLQNRIEFMRSHKKRNNIVIENYESMLKSRLSVLAWLRDGNNNHDHHTR